MKLDILIANTCNRQLSPAFFVFMGNFLIWVVMRWVLKVQEVCKSNLSRNSLNFYLRLRLETSFTVLILQQSMLRVLYSNEHLVRWQVKLSP